MALKIEFDMDEAVREHEMFIDSAKDAVIQAFFYRGERFVADARSMTKSMGGFGDVTGNLRSSIGYFILVDGIVIMRNFRGNSIGEYQALRLLEEVDKVRGVQLIGVAGMNYASAVESRGLNVISQQAEMMLLDLVDDISLIEKRFNK